MPVGPVSSAIPGALGGHGDPEVPRSGLSALDALAARRHHRASTLRSTKAEAAVDGPFDRRLTTNRRVSVTALVPNEVDCLAIRRTVGGVVLTTDLSQGPLIQVRQIGSRRELWLRGHEVRQVLPEIFAVRRDAKGRLRSVPLEISIRRFPNGHLELVLLKRHTRGVSW